MEPIECLICQKTNHMPERQVIVVSSFAQEYMAKQTLFGIQKSHISYVWQKIFVEDNIATLVLQLHGIKDIVNLQALYIESMCQENNALTVDVLSQKIHQDKFIHSLG